MALTLWPPGSTMLRSVWTNASRASRSASEACPRAIWSMSVLMPIPSPFSRRPTERPAFEQPRLCQQR